MRDDHPEHQQQIEQHVVDQRTQENRNHRESDQLACAVAGRRGASEPVGWSATSGTRSRPASASRTRTSAATYLTYSDSSSRKRRATGPPRLVAPFVADHRERNQRDIRHRVRQFDDRARHVVIRRHHDQRFEAALVRPAPRLRRVAAGVDGGTVEIDAAAQQRLVVGQRARNVAGRVGRMHAGDQQPLAIAAGQQFHRIGNPRRAAGQHHDAVGVAVRLDFGAAQLREKADEADRGADERHRQHRDDSRAQPAPRRGGRRFRRCIGRAAAHATLAILPRPQV